MPRYFTFSQCLDRLMQQHHITVSALAAITGSRTEIRKALMNALTAAKRAELYRRLCDKGVFSAEECRQLGCALETSRIGMEQYASRQAIERLLTGRQDGAQPCVLEDGELLRDRVASLMAADEVNILCFNCIFPSVVAALLPLFDDPQRKVRMLHYVQPDCRGFNAAELILCMSPILFDRRYSPFALPLWEQSGLLSPLGGNLLLFQSRTRQGIRELFFVVDAKTYELAPASAARLYPFVEHILDQLCPKPKPLKAYGQQAMDYSSLMMSCLSRELNRSTYSCGADMYFFQTPPNIALAAFRDKAAFTPKMAAMLEKRLFPIYEQRFQNLYTKKKPSYSVMSWDGCRQFLYTGMASDHFMGFRAFTPAERAVTFSTMLKAAEQNPAYSPILLRENGFSGPFHVMLYDKLGVVLGQPDTDYGPSSGYDYIFLNYPDFTGQCEDYFLNVLLKERCRSREESLRLLHAMLEDYVRASGLTV